LVARWRQRCAAGDPDPHQLLQRCARGWRRPPPRDRRGLPA